MLLAERNCMHRSFAVLLAEGRPKRRPADRLMSRAEHEQTVKISIDGRDVGVTTNLGRFGTTRFFPRSPSTGTARISPLLSPHPSQGRRNQRKLLTWGVGAKGPFHRSRPQNCITIRTHAPITASAEPVRARRFCGKLLCLLLCLGPVSLCPIKGFH